MRRWRKALARVSELPESSFGPCPYLVLEADSSLRIDECLEILSYDEAEIGLRLRGLFLTVRGHGLTMCSYASRSIRIRGTVKQLLLSDKRAEP